MANELSQDAGSKTKLLNDMQAMLQKIASEYERINAASKGLAGNLKQANSSLGGMAGSGTASSIAASQGNFSGGFSNYMQSQGGAVGFAKNVASTVLGVASSAASMLPSVQEAVSSQLLTSQAKFSGMQGDVNSVVKKAMGLGTTSSAQDTQIAIAQGAMNGVLPGLPGYNNQILNGTMQISNLTGSTQSAMQATTALNSGQSVNTLRMMGISVRGANGAERNPAAIFKDIYNFAVSQSGGALNASNIAIALQPGNGLANLLDAAASGDSNLRNALQQAALQFSKGGDLSKSSLTKTGQLTSALNSQSALNQSQFGLLAASQNPMAQGFTEANHLLVKATDHLSKIVTANQGLVKQMAKVETLLNSQIGSGLAGIASSLITGLAALGVGRGASGLAKGALGLIKKGFNFAKGKVGALATEAEVLGVEAGAGITMAAEDAVGVAATPASFGASDALAIAGNVATAAWAAKTVYNLQHKNKGGGLGQGAIVTPTTPAPSSSGAASAVLATGASLIGTPYSWGGGSIGGATRGTDQGSNTVGFDCSSFVQYAFARVGVMLPRTTYAQINCGVAVLPADAQPGDLLFFGNPVAPHHVAIYMGNGRMIQAPHTGAVISTSSVNLTSVSAVRRVLNGKTGTALNKNLLKNHGNNLLAQSPGAQATGLFSGLVGSSVPAGVDMNSIMGYDPATAMSGGSTGGSGMGQGNDSSYFSSSSTNMAQTYLSMNSQTGTLVHNAPSNGGTTIHYGGVTVPINLPQGAQIDEQKLATILKKELISLNINSGVVKG
jgi:cell wall-associated NlpC family hydrolase